MEPLQSEVSIQKIIAYFLSVLSILALFFPLFHKITLEINDSNGFGNYLGLITGLAGVIITITVFLIQNSTQDYSSQLMRMTFFRNKHFVFVLLYIFCSLLLFTFGVTFKISNSIKVRGFLLSVGLVFNFISLLIMSSYFMNILNTIKEIEGNVIRFIKFKSRIKELPFIGAISLDESSSYQIINQLVPIFDTLSKSISLNQNDVSSQCLKSIDNVVKVYLKETKHFKSMEDKVLLEIGDQSSFLVDTMIQCKNQKFMDKLPVFLGNIGGHALNYRFNIGGVNNHAVSFSRLLVTIFAKSYQFDRTSATKTAISSISKYVKICLNKEYYQSASTYYYDLKEIIDLCLKHPNFWSANLISFATNEQKNIIKEYVTTVQKGKNVELHSLESIFRNIFEIIKQSSKSFSQRDYGLIINSVFNLDSILVKICKVHSQLPPYKKVPDSLLNTIVGSYVRLCKNILSDSSIEVDFMFLNFLPEFLFFTQNIQQVGDRFDEQHNVLLTSFLNRMKSKITNKNIQYFDERYYSAIEDYFAVIIHSKNISLCEKQIGSLIEFYKEIKTIESVRSRDKDRLYKLLKIIGAFMEGEDDFREIITKLISAISRDFREPDFSGRKSIPSFFEQYDYLSFKHSFNDWHVYPLSIWPQKFQAELNQYINQDNLIKLRNFHQRIKDEKE